jgi:5-formyltetrahydrofolate cyclo-ligase
MKSKQEIRKQVEARRATLDPRWAEAASARIIRDFQTLEAFQSAGTIALYMAIGGEVNLDPLFPECWKSGKRTCIPVFNTEAKLYEMAEITHETDYKTGHYGIREPISPTPFPMHEIDLVAVPGVAFDRKGRRLGRGGGYYDRLLAGFSGLSVALAFDFQILPAIPTEPHDRPVDALVTETKIVNVL